MGVSTCQHRAILPPTVRVALASYGNLRISKIPADFEKVSQNIDLSAQEERQYR